MNTTHLEKAQSLLVVRRNGVCRESAFDSLLIHMPAPFVPPRTLEDRITLTLRSIWRDEWNMLTLVDRLEWMRKRAVRTKFLRERWPEYAASDIEHWYVDFRSLLDHIASIINELSDRPGQVSSSFHDLYKSSMPGRVLGQFEERLCGDWVKLLQSANWFPDIRRIRDAVVHQGAQVDVFGDPSDGVLFQVTLFEVGRRSRNNRKPYDHLVSCPEFMFNENVTHFEKYAAHYMSYLFTFLDEFAEIAGRRLNMSPGRKVQNYHAGFETVLKWMKSTGACQGD